MRIILTATDDALASAWRKFCGDLDFVEIHEGSILELSVDAAVSPANSFGFMDSGIDAVYRRFFGTEIQAKVQRMIAERHHGELLVGAADIVATGHARIAHLIVAPTMRVPMVLTETVNAYLAARAVFLLLKQHPLSRVAFPGLGTGVGQLSPNICARQMRAAIDEIVLGQFTLPRTWAQAAERHQLLYTDRLRRLQQKD